MREIATKTRLRWDKDTGEYRVQYIDDGNAFLRAAELARAKESELGIRRDAAMIPVGSIPMTKVMEIKEKYGIDLLNLRDRSERKRAFQIIEKNYPKLKTTNMRIG